MTTKTSIIFNYTRVAFPKYSQVWQSIVQTITYDIIYIMDRTSLIRHKAHRKRCFLQSNLLSFYTLLLLKKKSRIRQRNIILSKYLKQPNELGWYKLFYGENDEAFFVNIVMSRHLCSYFKYSQIITYTAIMQFKVEDRVVCQIVTVHLACYSAFIPIRCHIKHCQLCLVFLQQH